MSNTNNQVRRVLVVDDNCDAAESLAFLLSLEGFDVHLAYDGSQALREVDQFRPQVAIFDLNMPVMNGYEAAALLRASGAPPPKLVALSADDTLAARGLAANAGFEVHLTKPVRLPELLCAIG